ncbi:basic proline-rich protein-like isoform X2 [Eriocheir sinensis]|uniref:basic proline-rich protein-like isoform X2 n=1 Tax=Eriocheir sinensis TaxID=95602 RepID=UPI0021C6C281|nr:basic proline-rich protein-like isoform X2 [Eriocheir sinensis]
MQDVRHTAGQEPAPVVDRGAGQPPPPPAGQEEAPPAKVEPQSSGEESSSSSPIREPPQQQQQPPPPAATSSKPPVGQPGQRGAGPEGAAPAPLVHYNGAPTTGQGVSPREAPPRPAHHHHHHNPGSPPAHRQRPPLRLPPPPVQVPGPRPPLLPGMVRQPRPQGQPPPMMPPLLMVPPPSGPQQRPQMVPAPLPPPPPPPRYQDPPAASGHPGPGDAGHQFSRQEEEEDIPEGAAAPYPPQGRAPRRHPATLRISKWVNPIPPDPDDGQQQVGEQELATKMLQIQSKRFYIDVKQNRRGRFMKVAEIGADGRRNQVFLALSTAAEFRDHLSLFSDFYANLGPPNPDTLPEDGKLKSETMVKDNRRYYLDLKENSRGRFLRVSQTIARGGPRCQIAIPAQGMIEFRDALQELLDEFGTDDGGYKGELPEGRHMRVENKNFYFDIGQNNRGIYMRISEVKTNFRTAITIPEKSWSRFRDIFADYVDKMKDGGEKGPSESNK